MKRKIAFWLALLFYCSILPALPSRAAAPVIKDLIVKESPWVDVRAWGAVGNGVADDSAAIQAAIDNVEAMVTLADGGIKRGGTVFIPAGRWNLGTTGLTITGHNITLVGVGSGMGLNTGTHATTTLIYSGTGDAINAVNGGVENTLYQYGINIENLRIIQGTASRSGIYMYGPGDGHITNVQVQGGMDNNAGVQLRYAINYTVDLLHVFGNEQTADPTRYLKYGLYVDNSTTTVTVRKYYGSSCRVGASINNSWVNFDDSVLESSSTVALEARNSVIDYWGWFEDNELNIDYDNTSIVRVFNTYMDVRHAVKAFKLTGTGGYSSFSVKDSKISSDNTAPQYPYLFACSDGFSATSRLEFQNLIFGGSGKGDFLMCGPGPTDGFLGYDVAKFSDMQVQRYRFVLDNVQANTTYNQNIPIQGAASFTRYQLPEGGNIIGANLYYSDNVTAGEVSPSFYVNGVKSAYATYPGVTKLNATYGPTMVRAKEDYLKIRVSAGDNVTGHLITDNNFAPTGGTLIYEILVAHGRDGKD